MSGIDSRDENLSVFETTGTEGMICKLQDEDRYVTFETFMFGFTSGSLIKDKLYYVYKVFCFESPRKPLEEGRDCYPCKAKK